MPAFVAGIHVFRIAAKQDVDGRDKPGHDDFGTNYGVIPDLPLRGNPE
jgi:hypothetical protein